MKSLPYFECAVGNGQAQECIDREVSSYPTWQFSDEYIKSLPSEASQKLLDTELSKVNSALDMYEEAV